MIVADGSAMAPYHFFEQDWRGDEGWSHMLQNFPRCDKEFKRMIEQADRGDGVRVVYSDTCGKYTHSTYIQTVRPVFKYDGIIAPRTHY